MITKVIKCKSFGLNLEKTIHECNYDGIINMVKECANEIEECENAGTGDTPKSFAIRYKDGTLFQRSFRSSVHCGHMNGGEYFQHNIDTHNMSFAMHDIKCIEVKTSENENDIYVYGEYKIDDDLGELIF